MAVAQVSSAPNRAVYEAVLEHLQLDERRPDGLLLHAACELPSGEVQLIDVYESETALRAFAESRLIPAFAEAGVADAAMAGPRPVSYETFDLIR